ncbi:CcdB family protein [Variovorax sp. OV700]|jgi:toxin CcdB|uniref:CcdB family protein n=1 Tax=Variovorax sp. OV700 TaxID=1882826 RepID=UPI000B86D359|nr:CcdB family protein [Variovorax sp. OV700]
MAQFDLHKNRGAQRHVIPYVVIVQSAQFDRYRRRVVVPLVQRSALPGGAPLAGTRMNPVFRIEGEDVVLHPLDTVSVATDQLGERVGSLAEHGQQIADAMDELLTRSWG